MWGQSYFVINIEVSLLKNQGQTGIVLVDLQIFFVGPLSYIKALCRFFDDAKKK